ncbi:MAG: hypothetical protein R3A79_05325 [Nannocystaceae bacterium]
MSASPSTRREPPEELAASQALVLRILWAAFVATQAIFAGILIFLGPQLAQNADPEAAAAMLPVFAAVALSCAGLSLFGVPIIAARQGLDFTTATLLRFATAEAVGIFGLVLGFMGVELAYALAFLGAGALLILAQLPSDQSYRRFRDDVRNARSHER